jgi:peptidoglycan hydrolase-like protein with peptidoglycan-binding domain
MPLPYKLGDHGPEITAWQQWFNRYARAYAPGVDGYFGSDEVNSVSTMQRNVRPPQPVTGVFDQKLADAVGFKPPAAPQPRKRVLGVVFRGTGGIVGKDLVSLTCQGAVDLVEEQNPPWAATMGGLPVGVAGGVSDPSMDKAAAAASIAGKAMVDQRIKADPTLGIVIGGYSAGAGPAAEVREYVKAKYPKNYVCSFSFGDFVRPPGGCYYPWGPGVDPGGQGIGMTHSGDVTDPRHCWLSNHTAPPGMGVDIYTIVPLGVVGDLMRHCEDMVGEFSFTDMMTWLQALIRDIPIVVADAGITMPAVLKGLSSGPAGFAGFLLPLLISSLSGFIGGGNPDTLTGTAAAAKAAVIALTFLFAGTGPHIRYHIDEVWPGCTYLQLAIQHVRFWSTAYLSQHPAA